MINTKLTKTRFERLYKSEHDTNVKERMLLVLIVIYEKQIPAQVARDLHRSRTWASDWLKRYREEGIEGLKNRSKSGRPPDIQEEIVYQIQNELTSNKQGWTTKQVENLIITKTGIKYHYTHIYRLMHKWGFKQKVPRKVHVRTASKEEKESFKKQPERYWTI
ncbi:MAG: winged helix-turn-helix domain-containing protein [Nitrososphaeraceae archaeon]|nr:winged helix-turn-helix domain-containing protein [Nitrososphaeraceae archaeon]